MIDPITAVSFSIFENKGVYALLLGSGISRAAQIPTGWEITIDLVRRLALLEGVEEQVDWAEWYKAKFGKEPSYSDVLNSLAHTPDHRRAILHRYIEPSGLAFLTVGTDEASLRDAVNGSKSRNYVWAPMGRTIWDGEDRRSILESWKDEATASALLGAGFAKASHDFLDLAIKNFERLASTRW